MFELLKAILGGFPDVNIGRQLDRLFTTDSLSEVRAGISSGPLRGHGVDWWRNPEFNYTILSAQAGGQRDSSRIMQALLQAGANINDTGGHWGNTPLHSAISNSSTNNALWLIENGGNYGLQLDIQDHFPHPSGGHCANTALTLSVAKGTTHGSHSNTLFGMIPLPWGGRPAQGTVLEALLNHGANPNIQVHNGNTALHLAMLRRDVPAIEALCAHGARLDIVNHQGQTPLDMLRIGHAEARQIIHNQTGGQFTFPTEAHWTEQTPRINETLRTVERPAHPPAPAPTATQLTDSDNRTIGGSGSWRGVLRSLLHLPMPNSIRAWIAGGNAGIPITFVRPSSGNNGYVEVRVPAQRIAEVIGVRTDGAPHVLPGLAEAMGDSRPSSARFRSILRDIGYGVMEMPVIGAGDISDGNHRINALATLGRDVVVLVHPDHVDEFVRRTSAAVRSHQQPQPVQPTTTEQQPHASSTQHHHIAPPTPQQRPAQPASFRQRPRADFHHVRAGQAFGLAGVMAEAHHMQEHGATPLGVASVAANAAGLMPNNLGAGAGLAGAALSTVRAATEGYERGHALGGETGGAIGAGAHGGRQLGTAVLGAEMMAPGATVATVQQTGALIRNAPATIRALPQTVSTVRAGMTVTNAGNALRTAGSSMTLANAANLASGTANVAGTAGLLNAFTTASTAATDHAVEYVITGDANIDTNRHAEITARTIIAADPIGAVTGTVDAAAGLVGINSNLGRFNLDNAVSTVMGQSQTVTQGLTDMENLRRAQETAFQARTISANARPPEAAPAANQPRMPRMTDYAHLARVRHQVASYMQQTSGQAWTIDGKNVATQFDEIDWSGGNRITYMNAINRWAESQTRIVIANTSVWPDGVRSRDAVNTRNAAQSNVDLARATANEFNHFDNAVIAYNHARAAAHPPVVLPNGLPSNTPGQLASR